MRKTAALVSFRSGDGSHLVAGISHDLLDLGVGEGPTRLRLNDDAFVWKIDFNSRDFGLFPKCLLDAGRAERADHAMDGSGDCFREDRPTQAGDEDDG